MIVSLFVLSAVPALKLPGVPPTYDYSKSTSANYANPGARLRREFITSRAGLDYRFHVRYSLERQALQRQRRPPWWQQRPWRLLG